jgi:hypothetical protein
MFEVRKLKQQIKSIERSYAKDRQKLEQKKAPQEEFQQLEFSEFSAVEEIEKEIDWIVGTRLSRQARSFDVEVPPLSDTEMWQRDEYGPRVWFTSKGRAHVRKLIEEEKFRRFESWSRWVTKVILPLLSLLLAIVGTITGLRGIDLARKQMEGVRAAIVEMPHGVSVDFPIPPSGEARSNFTNSGSVLAHDVHFSLSLIFKETGQGMQERQILSKNETIPALAPTSVTTRPDVIIPFELTGGEHKQVLDTKAYIIAKGSYDYENGFGNRVGQQFCYAYLWGNNKFGRWTGACDDVQSQIRLAEKMAKP